MTPKGLGEVGGGGGGGEAEALNGSLGSIVLQRPSNRNPAGIKTKSFKCGTSLRQEVFCVPLFYLTRNICLFSSKSLNKKTNQQNRKICIFLLSWAPAIM